MESQQQNIGQVIVSCLQAMREQENVWEGLRVILQKIGQYTGADAGLVIHFDGVHNQGNIVVSYEKNPEAKALRGLERTLLSPISVAYNYYADQEVMEIDDINVFSQLCGICCQLCQLTPLHRFYGVRLMLDGKVWGSISILFNDTTKKISADELEMLKAMAYITENAVSREMGQRGAQNGEQDSAMSAERAKSFFFASVSHNIRTPLNSIMGFSELLKTVTDEEERRQLLNNILESGNNLRQIVDNVLDLSRLAVGRTEARLAMADAPALCQEAAKKYEEEAKEKGLEFKINFAENMAQVEVDKVRIVRILDMLLNNALKYTEKGGVSIQASLQGVVDGKATLHLSVTDTGCGIDEESQKRLLRPYEELGDNQSQMGGTGLSLALVKALVAMMGGNFYLRSELGKGSTFGLYLPVAVQDVETQPEPAPAACPLATMACPLTNFSVLVVDDVPLNLKLLGAYCKRLGIRHVESAANGLQALEILKTTPVNCILTDIWMPQMDGTGLAKALRENHDWDNIPIYAITADAAFPEGEDAKSFTGVMLKPVGVDKLTPILRSLMA